MTPTAALSQRQQDALDAVVDTLLPSFPEGVPSAFAADSPASASAASIQSFWQHRASQDPAYRDAVRCAIFQGLRSTRDRALLLGALTALSSRVGTRLLVGSSGSNYSSSMMMWDARSLVEASHEQRVALLQQLQHSSWQWRRQAFQGLRRLLCGLAFSFYDSNDNKRNPFWEGMGFPGPPPTWPRRLMEAEDPAQVERAQQRQVHVQTAVQASAERLRNVPESEHQFWDCDVVIVGSGAGGCVAASVLAEAGYHVILVEKGAYLAPSQISLQETDAMQQQYEQNGLLQTVDGVIMILAGSALGGGTAINWSCCLPLPEPVRREWSQDHGLTAFMDAEYEQALQCVMEKTGAQDKTRVVHNVMNQKVLESCQALHYDVDTTGQNLRSTEDPGAGYIGLGDRYGNKHGGIQAFLEPAVAQHGLEIVDQCRVDRILTAAPTTTTTHASPSPRPRAVGIECTVRDTQQRLTIRARKSVIVAAGALRTPCVLRASGFANPHIGQHLRLHPVTGCVGFYPRDQPPVDSFVGAPMTTVCHQFATATPPQRDANQNTKNSTTGDYYGCKIEVPISYPGLLACAFNWNSPQVFRARMQRFRNWMPLIVLQRDSGDGGSVRAAQDGSLDIEYQLQEQDLQSMIRGLQGCAEILHHAGAEELGTGHISDFGFQSQDGDFKDYLKSIEQRGAKNHEVGIFSAHQMGTCRLSTSPERGAVDPNGELWECDRLYVMDASVFPTASGANPMMTVVSTAYMLSQRLVLLLKLEEDRLSDKDRPTALELALQREKMRSDAWATTNQSRLRGLVWKGVMVAVPILSALLVARWRKKRD